MASVSAAVDGGAGSIAHWAGRGLDAKTTTRPPPPAARTSLMASVPDDGESSRRCQRRDDAGAAAEPEPEPEPPPPGAPTTTPPTDNAAAAEPEPEPPPEPPPQAAAAATYNVRDYQNPDAGAADQALAKPSKAKGNKKGGGGATHHVCFRCGKASAKCRSCGQCHRAWYCGRECQRADWRRHKTACRAAVAAEARRATRAREATAAARGLERRPSGVALFRGGRRVFPCCGDLGTFWAIKK